MNNKCTECKPICLSDNNIIINYCGECIALMIEEETKHPIVKPQNIDTKRSLLQKKESEIAELEFKMKKMREELIKMENEIKQKYEEYRTLELQ
jgi:hypothetical protein